VLGIFVGMLFEKSTPTPPQKLPEHLFLYCAYRSLPTDGHVGKPGPNSQFAPVLFM